MARYDAQLHNDSDRNVRQYKDLDLFFGKKQQSNFPNLYQLDPSLGGIRCPKCRIVDSTVSDLNPGTMAFFYSRQKNDQNNFFYIICICFFNIFCYFSFFCDSSRS